MADAFKKSFPYYHYTPKTFRGQAKKTFFFIFIFYLFESFGTGNAFKISFSYYHYSTKPFR
tara:strand:+ start:366 stop:548 length:183 start_codon:yes stop_codon:yes gene_type:complete